MSLKKKILIGFAVYLLLCVVVFCFIYLSWMRNVDKLYLTEFQKSIVLKERYGEIVKIKRSLTERERKYKQDMYTIKYTIYDKNNNKYVIQPVFYHDSQSIPAYIIDGELIYEKELLED